MIKRLPNGSLTKPSFILVGRFEREFAQFYRALAGGSRLPEQPSNRRLERIVREGLSIRRVRLRRVRRKGVPKLSHLGLLHALEDEHQARATVTVRPFRKPHGLM